MTKVATSVFIGISIMLINCKGIKIKTASEVKYFGVMYSDSLLDNTYDYELLILEPDFYTKEEVALLKSKGISVIAYLSLGEVNKWRGYFPSLQELGFRGENPVYGSYYVDVSNPEAKELFTDKIVPEILEKGFDGLFLDTIDAVSPYGFNSDLSEDMGLLIESISQRFPDAVLIQNAGFFLLDKTSEYIDAVTIESVSSSYKLNPEEYFLLSEEVFDQRLELAGSISQKYSLPLWIIDFAKEEGMKSAIHSRLKDKGYPYFISSASFNELPEFNINLEAN